MMMQVPLYVKLSQDYCPNYDLGIDDMANFHMHLVVGSLTYSSITTHLDIAFCNGISESVYGKF